MAAFRPNTVKNAIDFTIKYKQLAARAFNVNFTDACRLFTGITTHGRAEKGKVGNVGHSRNVSYRTVS